ncbi:MAG: hypothetical protein K2J83_03260 [Clostridia bacterium]|nr:hypothetical protein [Clostridia bacterium]
MKVKRLLRFYYCAEGLERAFENLILKIALSSYGKSCFYNADRLCRIIDEKSELNKLWNYLDGIIPALSQEERTSLKEYAEMRCGIKRLCGEDFKRIRRAVVKFKRRARRLDGFTRGAELVGKYYCLLF